MRALPILVILAALCALPPRTAAAELGPTKGSQLVSAFVTGACPIAGHTGTNSSLLSLMVNADGTTTAFTIPPKKIFVLTEITASTSAQPAGDVMLINVEIGSATAGNLVAGRFETVQSSGALASTFQFPTGIAVKSGSVLCVDMLDVTHGGFTGFGAFAHGYFAPDK